MTALALAVEGEPMGGERWPGTISMGKATSRERRRSSGYIGQKREPTAICVVQTEQARPPYEFGRRVGRGLRVDGRVAARGAEDSDSARSGSGSGTTDQLQELVDGVWDGNLAVTRGGPA